MRARQRLQQAVGVERLLVDLVEIAHREIDRQHEVAAVDHGAVAGIEDDRRIRRDAFRHEGVERALRGGEVGVHDDRHLEAEIGQVPRDGARIGDRIAQLIARTIGRVADDERDALRGLRAGGQRRERNEDREKPFQ